MYQALGGSEWGNQEHLQFCLSLSFLDGFALLISSILVPF